MFKKPIQNPVYFNVLIGNASPKADNYKYETYVSGLCRPLGTVRFITFGKWMRF